MPPGAQKDPTALLTRATRGDADAVRDLTPVLYEQLRQLAAAQFRAERPDHLLQPTALVHEAWLRLINQPAAQAAERTHFFGLAGRVMRQVLIDHARRRDAQKRGGDRRRITLTTNAAHLSHQPHIDLLDLEDALQRLHDLDPRKASLVELRFYGGLTVEEAAAMLDVSVSTAEDDWRVARAWLRKELATMSES